MNKQELKEIRENLNGMIGVRTVVKIKDTNGYYFNDMKGEIFTEEDRDYYYQLIKNEQYSFTSLDYNFVRESYLLELREL